LRTDKHKPLYQILNGQGISVIQAMIEYFTRLKANVGSLNIFINR
jgi:hypothetical protein